MKASMALILLVEDNADMLMMLTQVLKWGGYDVMAGRSGQEGLDLLGQARRLPDLIISDLSMPDMNGLEFLDTVRNNPSWSHVPFVIMSAHSASDEANDALARGADDFLVKPFNLDDFQKILNRWNHSDS
jgi:CheY-like chemotaxis protein